MSSEALYEDGPNPPGYQPNPPGYQKAAGGRPAPAAAQPYSPPRLGKKAPSRTWVLLFTLDNYPDPGDVFEGVIPDPIPAGHYAQLLLDAAELGQTAAEFNMINRVMGEHNLKALAAAPDLDPEGLKSILAQVFERAMGPYRAGQGNEQSA